MTRRLRPNILTTLLLLCLAAASSAAERPVEAERITFRWSESGIEILSRIPMQKVLPPSMTLPDTAASQPLRGAWFELKSETGETLYRRPMETVNIAYTEAPADPGSQSLSRAETPVESKVISIVIPKRPNAARVILHGPNPADKTTRTTAAEVGRIELK